jgi:hypothetical protein
MLHAANALLVLREQPWQQTGLGNVTLNLILEQGLTVLLGVTRDQLLLLDSS